jgi:hypothetical protein
LKSNKGDLVGTNTRYGFVENMKSVATGIVDTNQCSDRRIVAKQFAIKEHLRDVEASLFGPHWNVLKYVKGFMWDALFGALVALYRVCSLSNSRAAGPAPL